MEEPFPFQLQGGLDLVTPALLMRPGRMISGYNYECVVAGYRRHGGFERFDGRAKPSDATYAVLRFDAGVATITAGQTVAGATSGATAYVLLTAVVETGTYGGSNAAGYLVISEITGTFQDNENLQVAAVTKSVANGIPIDHGASTLANDAAWTALSIEHRRSLIAVPPSSSGTIRGVWTYKGDKYCFRDNAGATAGIMFKATTAGWVAQSLGRTVAFTSGGVYEILDGDTITGATSAATAVVGRVILTSGTWAGGTAAGRLILTSQVGNFVAENLNVGANLNVATIAANSTAQALPPGGRYSFKNHNFFGQAVTLRMYGANGVGNAFEWDGTVFVPIISGVAIDTPTFIDVHKEHLMLGFINGSLVTSDPGDPYSFTTAGGSTEIAVGFTLAGLLSDIAGVMVVFGTTGISVLYGTDADTWDLKGLAEDADCHPNTVQMIGGPYYLDDQGVRSLTTTQAFGNFVIGTATESIQTIFEQKRKSGATAVASLRVRKKNQYRLFFSDNTGISIYFRTRSSAIGPVQSPECALFDLGFAVSCSCSGEDTGGNEELFVGRSNGFVYQMDSGTSFDGVAVRAFARVNFVSCRLPQWVKRWFGADIELDAPSSASLAMTAIFDYGNTAIPAAQEQAFPIVGPGGLWDESAWDEFVWDTSLKSVLRSRFSAQSKNVSIIIMSDEAYAKEHTLQAVTLLFSKRKLSR